MSGEFYTGSLGSLKGFWEERGRTKSFEKGYSIRFEGVEKMVREIYEFLDGKFVLDVGCGPGVAARLFPPSTRVIGLDFSIAMLESAKNSIPNLMQGSAFNLPFQGKQFDAVTCFFVASDYSEKIGIFSEAHRVLKDNGSLLFADYSMNDEHWRLKRMIRPIMGEACNIFIESEKSISDKIGQVGFEVQNVKHIRFHPAFKFRWYVKSEDEMSRIRSSDEGLWKRVWGHIENEKISRDFIVVISKK